MPIVPPGTTKTLLLVGGLTVGVGDVEPDGGVDEAEEEADDVPDGDDALALEVTDLVGVTAGELDAGATRVVTVFGGGVGRIELWRGALVVGRTGGGTADGAGCPGEGLVVGFARADDSDAADCEAASTALATPPWVESCCVPLTSCPTRSTAVSVMVVTTAQESSHPSARVRGRPDQLRGSSAGAPDCRRRLFGGSSGRLPRPV
jgi:hypothetical protein